MKKFRFLSILVLMLTLILVAPKVTMAGNLSFEKDEVIEYTKWLNRQIEINNLGSSGNDSLPDETVNKFLQQCKDYRERQVIPYLDKLGNCELVLLGGDHMIYEQKPNECGIIIKDFVESLSE